MRKIKISLLVLLIILILTLTIILTQSKESNLDYYTRTKAICNETNYCQDYQVSCNEKRIIMTTPITGAFIQFDKSWQDPRSELEKKLC